MDFLESFIPSSHQDAEQNYQAVYHGQHHQSSLGHEAVAGAAGFAAMHAYESHLRASGQEPSHAKMKEILAGIAAAEVDKLVETKGMDWVDRHKAKQAAIKQAHHLANQRYGHEGTGFRYAQEQGGHAQAYDYQSGSPYGMQGHPAYEQYGMQYGGGYGGPPQQYYPPPQAPYGGQQYGYQQPPPQQYGGYQPQYGAPPPPQWGGQGGGY